MTLNLRQKATGTKWEHKGISSTTPNLEKYGYRYTHILKSVEEKKVYREKNDGM